jgi:hypothetical protein
VNSKNYIVSGALAALLLAGCGGLDSPDLGTGQVSGRLTGNFKRGAAFAYALGAPQTKVLVADDGSYTLDEVPVTSSGKAQVVLFDGDVRADVEVADVRPASRTRANDRDSGTLALAGRVVAAVRCSGGASGKNTSYRVDEAALAADASGDVAELFPLPAGVFNVRAALSGFRENARSVAVASGATTTIELDLELDEDDDERGCIANGCSDGRDCDEHDGRCYACTNDLECAPGQQCDDHVCVLESGIERPACAPCTTDGECHAPSGLSPRCITDTVSGMNVCSSTCAQNSDCPAGFACSSGTCAPPAGCLAYLEEFGSVCFEDAQCALSDAKCFGAGGSTPGYCTSRCNSNSDCPEYLFYRCEQEPGGSNNFCLR